jgi:hypothetical protein
MEKRKNCFCRIRTDEPEEGIRSGGGWILALTLFLLIVIQGLALASLSLAKYQIKAGSAFFHIIRGNHHSTHDDPVPVVNRFRLPAPEGWDQVCFSTELNETVQGKEKCYSWRIGDSGSPGTCTDEVLLGSSRPHIVFIVDDSGNMNKSSGKDYENDSLYLKRVSGETVWISNASEVETSAVAQEGTFFRGSYGNLHLQAPANGTLTGAMPIWAQSFSRARSLVDSLELCETAVMSTSRGIVQGFTHDYRMIARALDSIHPASHEARLAETLYQATTLFPKDCPTAGDIVLVTSGQAVNDGNLPEWLKDFDGDANPDDRAIQGEGSHCADDVAAYALSRGIRVHVIGPDIEFIRKIAERGGGRYLPDRDSFVTDHSFVCQGMVLYGKTELMPKNRLAVFNPPWLQATHYAAFRPSVLDPSILVSCPNLNIQGLASSLLLSGSNLFCTTSRDNLLNISLPSGDLKWLVSGMGGTAVAREGRILAGPNSSGDIYCIDGQPTICWSDKGSCFDASSTSVYLAKGSSITARHLDSGVSIANADAGRDITCLRYDAGSAELLAGTNDGLIVCYNQGLQLTRIISVSGEAIRDIRPFLWRKKTFILAMDRKTVVCSTFEARQWSVSLDDGLPVSCLVADKKVYLNAWKEGSPCGGIDTGTSKLVILDAFTGNRIETKNLFSGKAFGPVLDITGKRIVYTSWDGTSYNEDIADIPGIAWTTAGRRIARPER